MKTASAEVTKRYALWIEFPGAPVLTVDESGMVMVGGVEEKDMAAVGRSLVAIAKQVLKGGNDVKG